MAQVQVQPPAAAIAPVPVSAPNGGAPANASGGGAFVCTLLYVSDLDFTVNDSQLFDLFDQIGQAHWVRICREFTTRRSLGYGYVNYLSPHDAARALDVLNFTPLNGKTIRIMCSHYYPSIFKSDSKNIFVKNLDKSIDHKALYDTFSTFGKILSCEIAMDDNGQSKGCGFVKFDCENSTHKAIEKLNGMLLNDKQVFVGHLIRKQERDIVVNQTKFNNIYVKNLSESTTDEDMRKAFGEYGPVTSAQVKRNADGKSKCFGFVKFENADDAARAVEALNGKKFDGNEWYVGKEQKKSEREEEVGNLEKAPASTGARQRITQVKKKTDDKDGEKDMQMQYRDEESEMMQKQEQRATMQEISDLKNKFEGHETNYMRLGIRFGFGIFVLLLIKLIKKAIM